MINRSLLALATGTFALGIAEFAMMAILGEVATSLHISIPEAGHFISAYSIGVAAGAVALPFMNSLPLKTILLGLCAIMALGNLASACATGPATLLGGRFLSGLPHGAYFGTAAIVAVRTAGYGEKASAVALMVSGMTIANVVGVPFATFIATTFNWRFAFFLVVAASICAFFGILYRVPNQLSNSQSKCQNFSCQFIFLKHAAPWLIFLGTFFGQAALYCWYSYIEPAMTHVTGFSLSSMTYIMILCGTGMVFGGLVSGRLADRHAPGLLTGLICVGMLPTLYCIFLFDGNKLLTLVFAFIGASEIFALGGPLQYLIVRYSRGGELLGGAGIQVAFNVANAFAAWLGGLAIAHGWGYSSPALMGMPLAFLGACALFIFHFKYLSKNKT